MLVEKAAAVSPEVLKVSTMGEEVLMSHVVMLSTGIKLVNESLSATAV